MVPHQSKSTLLLCEEQVLGDTFFAQGTTVVVGSSSGGGLTFIGVC
jgi:hypothetical protein